MKLLLKILLLFMLIVLVVTCILFVDFTVKTFSYRQRDVGTDAIVVLAGGRGRVEEGVKLYRKGKGKQLFLVGVDPKVRKEHLFKDRTGENISEGVVLEKVSRNTLENALYARELLMKSEVRSISLITSRYHMKRAILLFRSTLPLDIAIYSHPVDSKNLKEEWWSHGNSIRLLFTEFYKYYMFRFFFLFASSELRPMSVPMDANPSYSLP